MLFEKSGGVSHRGDAAGDRAGVGPEFELVCLEFGGLVAGSLDLEGEGFPVGGAEDVRQSRGIAVAVDLPGVCVVERVKKA